MMERTGKLIDRQNKAAMNDLLQKIETAKDLDEVRAQLAAALNSTKSTEPIKDRELYPFDKEKECEVFASDEVVCLKPLDETVREPFLSIIEGNATFPQAFELEGYKDSIWNSHFKEGVFYCSIYKATTNEFAGYCGIKGTGTEKWEFAIELLPVFQRQGIGKHALELLMTGLSQSAEQHLFLAKVDPDNEPSQKLMEKLNGIPSGIEKFIITDDKVIKEIEEECANEVDDRLRSLADKFQVRPEALLCHILVYTFER